MRGRGSAKSFGLVKGSARLGCRERHIRVTGRAANGTFAAFNDPKVPFAAPHLPRKCLSRHQAKGADTRTRLCRPPVRVRLGALPGSWGVGPDMRSRRAGAEAGQVTWRSDHPAKGWRRPVNVPTGRLKSPDGEAVPTHEGRNQAAQVSPCPILPRPRPRGPHPDQSQSTVTLSVNCQLISPAKEVRDPCPPDYGKSFCRFPR